MRLVVGVPHDSALRRIEQHPGIHRGRVTIAKKLVVVFPVSRWVKGETILTQAPTDRDVATPTVVPFFRL
jgi:hypothetical protein